MASSGAAPTTEARTPPAAETEVAAHAALSRVLYAQCWEDADVLVAAVRPRPGGTYLSVASAGDNSLALLTRDPERVIAVDISPAQLACVELRVAAYRCLSHAELLELMGSRPSARRGALYDTCCAALASPATRVFWDARRDAIVAHGLGGVGRFERYFRVFRRLVLPVVHGRRTVDALLAARDRSAREEFYRTRWDTWRHRMLVRAFFSRRVMARLGREPAFFAHAEEALSAHVLRRVRHAFVDLDPAANPYLRWILRGDHGAELPLALRAESFDAIRRNLDRLELRRCSVEQAAADLRRGGESLDGANLSDVFEYMSEDGYHEALAGIVDAAAPGARLVYWNMLVPRSRPESMAGRLRPLEAAAADLHARDRAFFYRRLCIEEVR